MQVATVQTKVSSSRLKTFKMRETLGDQLTTYL
jgi:hypothetical protein